MRNLAFVALGLALAALETIIEHLLPLEHLAPDLVLPLILYFGLLGFNAARGAAIAFIVGYFVDAIQPGAPICLNMFVLVSVFLTTRLLASRLLLAGTVFHIGVTLMGSLGSSLLIILVRAIFERTLANLGPLVLIIGTRAVSTAIAAPFVFALARRLDARRFQRREERTIH